MRQEKDEPVFSMQEQAVVYLFSRYWEREVFGNSFKGKKVTRIHTHFPDFSIENAQGKAEGIEFEYGLKAFHSHLNKGLTKLTSECRRKLKDEGIRVLYIIYWDHNEDIATIKKAVRQSGIVPRFICFKEYFEAGVARGLKGDPLRTFWRYSEEPLEDAYPIKKIQDAANALTKEREITELTIDKSRQLYRTLGWDKKGSDFNECDHWEKIHFFTATTRMAHDAVPRRLFLKPNGYQHFIGYFDMKRAFKLERVGKGVRQFFKDYYFYDYNPQYHHDREKWFVCSFKRLDYEQGRALFEFLKKKGYKVGVRSSVLIEKKDNARINKIIEAR